MNQSAERRVRRLQQSGERGLLRGSRRGIEKESLRVTPDGHIAQTPHPLALGSALCHPSITTDYSEALLELVTAAYTDVDAALARLDDLHRYVYAHLDQELLWVTSMPCIVGGDDQIPIADYGTSNIGKMKHVYRRGLAWRYGRSMQAIAGIHFNYSFSEAFLRAVQKREEDTRDFVVFRSEFYFRLIRNFQRYGWLVPFLMGASPAICRSFTGGRNLGFENFSKYTLYSPHATSLRMSDIGYKNNAQAALNISYSDLNSYVETLRAAICTPDPEYGRIGTRVDGEWRQLNTNILQIENEYYSFVRPKAIAQSGEQPTCALKRAGVEYVEIRALDLDPFEPIGLSAQQVEFLEVVLLFCLLEDSPPIEPAEQSHINANQGLVARSGRDPELTLYRSDGHRVKLQDWATDLLDAMSGPAELLDEVHGDARYSKALSHYREMVSQPEAAPSARVIREMSEQNEEFVEFAGRLSQQHSETLRRRPLSSVAHEALAAEAHDSIADQQQIEASPEIPFEEFLERYFAQEPTVGS